MGTPLDEAIASIPALVAVDEVQHLLLSAQPGQGGEGSLHIFGMDKIEKLPPLQGVGVISQDFFPCLVGFNKVSLGIRDAEEIQVHLKKIFQLFGFLLFRGNVDEERGKVPLFGGKDLYLVPPFQNFRKLLEGFALPSQGHLSVKIYPIKR